MLANKKRQAPLKSVASANITLSNISKNRNSKQNFEINKNSGGSNTTYPMQPLGDAQFLGSPVTAGVTILSNQRNSNTTPVDG